MIENINITTVHYYLPNSMVKIHSEFTKTLEDDDEKTPQKYNINIKSKYYIVVQHKIIFQLIYIYNNHMVVRKMFINFFFLIRLGSIIAY